jgi:GntR family transcriptional regulator
VIPFGLSFEPGASLYEQVVYAAKRAIVSGQMRPGDPFPSVRVLSMALKINPNTAHKVIGHLVAQGVLEVRPGIGTVVAKDWGSSAAERSKLLKTELEQLVVEAKKLGLDLDEVSEALTRHWQRLEKSDHERNTPNHSAFQTVWQDYGTQPDEPDRARRQRLRPAGAKRRG